MFSYGRAQFFMKAAQTFDVEHFLRNIPEYPSKRPIPIRSEELVELYAHPDTNAR